MNDTEQKAYDAANKKIYELENELYFYRNLASHWHDIAYQLMSVDRLHDEHESVIKEGNNADE